MVHWVRCASVTVAVIAVGLVCGGLAALPSVALDCSSSAQDAAAAAAVAERCDRDVEVVSDRTPWNTTYATPDGLTRLDLSVGAVRTKVDGRWVDVDNDVVDGVAGYEVKAPVAPMTFSDGTAGQPLATIEHGGDRIEYGFPLDLPAPTVDGSALTYGDVLPGVDLVVNVNSDATGFSEVLRIEDPAAAANPALANLTFPIETNDSLDVVRKDGGFAAVDDSGAVVFSSPAPTMWDSSGEVDVPGESTPASVDDRNIAPLAGDVVTTMANTVSDDSLTVTPDQSMLTDPDTQWPVYVDPSFSKSPYEWAALRTATWGTKYKFADNEGLGFCDYSVDSACQQDYKERLVWEFHGLDQVANVASADVLSATFSAVGTWSYSCTPAEVSAFRVPNFSSTSTWSVWDDTADGQSTLNTANRPGCTGDNLPGTDEWSVTDAAKWVAAQNTTALSIGLKAHSETSMSSWHRYEGDSARLSITFNQAPVLQSGTMKVAGKSCGSLINDRTPTLAAKYVDPNPDLVKANLNVYTSGNVLTWDGAYTGFLTATTDNPASFLVTSGNLASDGDYYMEVYATDNYASPRTSVHSTCAFTLDATPPAVPTVKTVLGQPAVYAENQTSGGAGLTGKFTLSSTSADVDHLLYGFDTDNPTTPAANGATISFTPAVTDRLDRRLVVKAVDKAGNTSSPKTWAFNVESIAERWTLNGNSATTAVDTAGSSNTFAITGATPVDGPLKEAGFDESDYALHFDPTAGSTAVTNSAPISAKDPYAVVALVKVDSVGNYTAVSEDGTNVSPFQLGLVQDATCPSGCWAFTAYPSDSSTAVPSRAVSTLPVQTNTWTLIAGVHDTSTGTIAVQTCTVGGSPEGAQSTPFATTWDVKGKLRLGQALQAGTATQAWPGAIDDVTVYSTFDSDQLRRRCNPF